MKNMSDERITDIVIGEAVMQLVNTGADISWSAVTLTLQRQLKMEQDSERAEAMYRAIARMQEELRAHLVSERSLSYPPAERRLH